MSESLEAARAALGTMRLRAERAEQRIRECALIMGVPDGGQYLNDWKDAKRAAVAERDRLREALLGLAWRDSERRCWCLEGFMPFKKEHEPECMAAAAALGFGPGRGENEGER
jgi:hypothetical protein